MPICRFVFMIRFRSEEDLQDYMRLWRDSSEIIQDESPGARGTKLHRLEGDVPAVLAIAEWESREARDRAFAALSEKYPPDHLVFQRGKGEVTIIGHADEIDVVFPAASQ
jgi:hypothetical protein